MGRTSWCSIVLYNYVQLGFSSNSKSDMSQRAASCNFRVAPNANRISAFNFFAFSTFGMSANENNKDDVFH